MSRFFRKIRNRFRKGKKLANTLPAPDGISPTLAARDTITNHNQYSKTTDIHERSPWRAPIETSPNADHNVPIAIKATLPSSLRPAREPRTQYRAHNSSDQDKYNNYENTFPTVISSPGAEFFRSSHPVFNAPVNMVETFKAYSPESNKVDKFQRVLQRLAEKSMSAAIYNSSYRESYRPRCHAETRFSIRVDIMNWGANPRGKQRMRWYLGPPGVGKSAIAQIVAESLAEEDRLGATFFFSRPGKVDEPNAVVPTLVYQLAKRHPRYRQIITERLYNDPFMLEMDRPTQFRALILEPFRIIALEVESSLDEPLLVIIDGLDECKDKTAQCELIRLINSDVARAESSQLLWMVCSRPEWHLKDILADTESVIHCQREEIHVDNEEAQADARRILRTGLDGIRRQNHLPSNWPLKEQVDVIAHAASGHLGFVSFLLRFIKGTADDDDDDDDTDPAEKFRFCMKIVSGVGIDPKTRNPLKALDLLYDQILSKIPESVLPTTMRILGLSILYAGQLMAHDLAMFLDIPHTTFQRSLKHLHSVVDVPSPTESEMAPLRLYHASFSDFLRDPSRSNKFCLDEGSVHFDVVVQSLAWLGRSQSDKRETFFDAMDFESSMLSDFARVTLGQPLRAIDFSQDVVWDACREVPEGNMPSMMDILARFDFRPLEVTNHGSFAEFLRWLYTQVPTSQSLISFVHGPPKAISSTLRITHTPNDPTEFCAAFSLNVHQDQLPITLNFVVGNVKHVQILVEYHESFATAYSFPVVSVH